jgi:hypothetical protein
VITFTADTSELYALAMDRHPATGELINLVYTNSIDEARDYYDRGVGVGLVKLTLEVLSSVDHVVDIERTTNEDHH